MTHILTSNDWYSTHRVVSPDEIRTKGSSDQSISLRCRNLSNSLS